MTDLTLRDPARAAPSTYWEERAKRFAHQGWGLRAVCSYGMPAFYNGYIHLVQRRALADWLRVPPDTAVLEVGCGIGRWSRRLAGAGAQVVGTDLSPAMVAEARRRAVRDGIDGRCEFRVADAAALNLNRRFDRILCVTVLQHVLEAERLEAAIRGMADHLAPGGRLIVMEAAPSARVTRCNTATFVARREDEYRAVFARAGLVCHATYGVDPLPLKTWYLPRYATAPRVAATAGLFAVTAVTLPFDLLAARWMSRASWHKVFVLAHEAAA